MNSNDCELTITVYYKDKSFEMKTKEIITIETLKEQAIQKFNISKIFQECIKFYIPCQNKQKIYMLSEDDIILNADDSNIDNPKITLYLSVNDDKENNNILNVNKNVGYNVIIIKKQSEKNKNKNNNKYLEDFANLKIDINTLSEMLEEEKKKNNILMEENKYLKKMVENNNNEIKNIKDTLKTIEKFIHSKNNENVHNHEKNEENGNQENNDNNNVNSISIEEKEKNLNDNLKNNNVYVTRTVKEDVNNVSEGVRREKNEKDNCTSQVFQESNSFVLQETKKNSEKCTSEKVKENFDKKSTLENFESKASKDNKSDMKNSTNQNNNNLEEMVKKIRKDYGSDLDKISDEIIKEKLEENDGDFEKTVIDLILAATNLIKGKK